MKTYLLPSESGNHKIRNSPSNIPGTILATHTRNTARNLNKLLFLKRYLLVIQIKRPAKMEEKYIAEIDENMLTIN
jgi:hypothetical protein